MHNQTGASEMCCELWEVRRGNAHWLLVPPNVSLEEVSYNCSQANGVFHGEWRGCQMAPEGWCIEILTCLEHGDAQRQANYELSSQSNHKEEGFCFKPYSSTPRGDRVNPSRIMPFEVTDTAGPRSSTLKSCLGKWSQCMIPRGYFPNQVWSRAFQSTSDTSYNSAWVVGNKFISEAVCRPWRG